MEPGIHASNEDSAFVAHLTENQVSIMLYIRALMPGDGAVHDVIQQTNAKIWEKRADFLDGTNFRAWALAIARYEVLNHRKQQARDARLRFSDELETTIADELSHLDDDLADRHEALRECMKTIQPKNRELLMLRYGSKETLADFAERIGRSVGGLKVTLHRLRSALAECIERRLLTTGGSE